MSKESLVTNQGLEFVKEELAVLKTVNCQQIATVLKIFEEQEDFYIVMELFELGDLEKVVEDLYSEDGGGVTEPMVQYILKQLFIGLNYLHSKGICHRDVKTQNICVDKIRPYTRDSSNEKKLMIKLIDFGYAQSREEVD